MTLKSAAQALRDTATDLHRAAHLILDGGVLALLQEQLGPVEVVGSAAMSLMVYPDIDLYVSLDPDQGRRLVSLIPVMHDRLNGLGFTVVRTVLNDEYRRPNIAGEGYYSGYSFQPGAAGRREWKIDLWAWSPGSFAARLARHTALAARLADADRDTILLIKDAVSRRPEYRKGVTSMDVYNFALSGQGATVEDFDAFLKAQKSP